MKARITVTVTREIDLEQDYFDPGATNETKLAGEIEYADSLFHEWIEADDIQWVTKGELIPDGQPTRHELKTWPGYFQAVLDGRKPFEVRENDRNFQVGDLLLLREYDPKIREYSGREITKKVTFFLSDPMFVKAGYVVMGLGDGEK